jgi:twitching motility protein PilT
VQREIGTDTGSFPNALRAALRQDPNVIMIGEMRDTETIDIALKAAETGHLVLSTAHTTDAARTVHRIVSAFPISEQQMIRIRLADSLRAVVSMRLLPRQDGTGLIPAMEVLLATNVIRECIRDETRADEMTEYMVKGRMYGMQTFDQDLLRLLREGLISREAAVSAATSPADLELRLRLGLGDDEDEEMMIERHQYPEPPETIDIGEPSPIRPG